VSVLAVATVGLHTWTYGLRQSMDSRLTVEVLAKCEVQLPGTVHFLHGEAGPGLVRVRSVNDAGGHSYSNADQVSFPFLQH
jgi:hypothetical protein